MTRAKIFVATARRFLAEEEGGAGTEYVVFATCWGLAVSTGLYFTTNLLAAKFEAVTTALKGVDSSLR